MWLDYVCLNKLLPERFIKIETHRANNRNVAAHFISFEIRYIKTNKNDILKIT